jgi:hypothetical protein
MADPDPIACSLDGGELATRLAAANDAGRSTLVSHERSGRAHLLGFRRNPDTASRLEEIVEAERRCCPFLKLELTLEADTILLLIEAPPGGEPIAAGLAAAFAEEGPA